MESPSVHDNSLDDIAYALPGEEDTFADMPHLCGHTPPPLAVERPLAERPFAVERPFAERPFSHLPSSPVSNLENKEAPTGFMPTAFWDEEPRNRRRHYRPSFDWSDAIDNELARFSPQQYIQYTFESTVLLTILFPRVALIPASLLMARRLINMGNQLAFGVMLKNDDKIARYAFTVAIICFNLLYTGLILGLI
jgi:hypothetical protein